MDEDTEEYDGTITFEMPEHRGHDVLGGLAHLAQYHENEGEFKRAREVWDFRDQIVAQFKEQTPGDY